MISMQRAPSSPVAIRPSSPRSAPASTTSRSPTPSPPDSSHAEFVRPRRLRSRSPSRANRDPVNGTARRYDDLPRHPSVLHIPGPSLARSRPIVDQPSSQLAAPAPGDSSDSLGTTGFPDSLPDDKRANMKFLRPLLADVSLYTNPSLCPESEESTTLGELAHLVRLSKFQERRRANGRIRLQRSLISTALSARLMRCGEMAHRNLVDGFREDDKKTFGALYNAVMDVRRSCDETRRYALLEPEMELLQPPGAASSENLETPTASVAGSGAPLNSVAPFLNELSASTREAFLHFLTQIRTNPDYLATRIASLKNSELAALTSFHQTLEPIDSVLPYHGRSSSRNPSGSAAGGSGGASKERSAIERLLSFQRHDPISALIFTCFAVSAGPDSDEDKRRTATWANTCARLISAQTTGSEQTVISVLNVWVSMRDWAGRSNMEWYLMKILEDGAFLLDRAEDQHGTRFNLSDWSSKDQIAAEEFYARAVDELFEVIDDEDATGIPEGLLELGNEILKRLERRYIESTRKWLIAKYMFTVWLLGVVIHPEAYGMMAEYHITEYGRQKILKAVAMQAQKYVVDRLQSVTPVSTPAKIKAHIESIYGRFKDPSQVRKTPRLLPARSVTSLRQTAEVRPFLVISPADLVTMVNALFPERRPRSAHSSGLRSGAPSVSGFSAVSQPMSIRTAPSTLDSMSVLSTSAESSFSDATTSREPLLEEECSPRRHSPAAQAAEKPNSYEEDGYRLRLAVDEMTQVLGQEVVNGSCHPCAERWSVLFISGDGNKLSNHMMFDPDDGVEDGENSSNTSDTEGEETDDGLPELSKEYHWLRDSIMKLVQEYEIPQELERGATKQQTFSNRASTLKKYRSPNRRAITTMESRNPYRQRAASFASRLAESPPESAKGKESAEDGADSSPLITMLTAAYSQSYAQSDFVNAQVYWRALQRLNSLTSESLRRNGFAALLNIFARGPRDSIRRSTAAIEEYDAWLVWLKQSQERAEGLIESMMRRLRALRDKMWYVTDVRNSAPYEESRNVAVALKAMGQPRRWSSFQRVKNPMQRGPASNYIFRTESQVLDLLAAPEEQGGPNKLRDEQAEKTARWLHQYGVENFCQGEERIHRFCCEVDYCVSRLVGDSMMDSPVLWSSELYARDRRAFESGGRSQRERDRDNQSVSWDDSISVVSDPDKRFVTISRPGSINSRDSRALSGGNVSQISFDSSRFSFSRASTAMSEAADGSEYFGASSPVHQIDPNATFWSPFQHRATSPTATSRAHSPTTSMTNLSGSLYPPHHQALPPQAQSSARSGASVSSNEAAASQQRQSEEKARFLAELRQTLTSLLLSDLGNLVFARGSETDAWFEGLGQQCIDHREAIQRRARKAQAEEKRRSARSGLKQRFLERNRSFGDLRGIGGGNDATSDKALSDTQSLGPEGAAGSQRGSQRGSHRGSIHDNESTATSDTISARKHNSHPESKRESMPDFPFTKAYQRLLKMFCVHPNPYAKLNALYELEHLIVAFLSSGSRRSRLAWARSELGSASSATEEPAAGAAGGRSQPLDEAIDNVKERRSQTLMQTPPVGSGGHAQTGRVSGGAGNNETRSVVSVHPANTDAVANVLQALFRDPSLRPKTLFRDLQFISAFCSPSVLDKTERGKAFWDAGLAALSLKQEVCRTMVEVADEILQNYTHSRNSSTAAGSSSNNDHRRAGSTASDSTAATPTSEYPPRSPSPPPSPPSPLPLSTRSMADAARMWTITAKEGHPTGQRELALSYLSNPELVPRITLPLSKPREVFKRAVMEKYGGSSSGGRYGHGHGHGHHRGGGCGAGADGQGGSGDGVGGDMGDAGGAAANRLGDVRSDPALMCMAIHWMAAAERGGDKPARTFLEQLEMRG
ncbi:hypothetical protein VTH06DRAFT_6858 [Thermothelomyces fergusii]